MEATYINHDTDLLDVTLRVSASSASSSSSAIATAPAATTATSKTPKATHDETIHTTANHPWLTADHGWLVAGKLHVGEPVREADGRVATVEAVRVIPGAASMWDLTVSNVHDFAVGDAAFVVHNCTNPVLDQEASQAHDLIKFGSQPDHPLTVAVADIQHASGDVEHVAALNQHAWTESNIDATVLSWATEGQTGVATTILDDPALLQGVTQQAAGHAHAEEYIAGYMANNPGSRLLGIGTSTIPCPTCAAIIGGLPR